MSQDHLAAYLNDHLAGSVGAIELLDEVIRHETDAQTKSPLTQLNSDMETLRLEAAREAFATASDH